jgi:HlyD family secretion protein
MKTLWNFGKRLLLVGLAVLGVGYAVYYSVWGQQAAPASELKVSDRPSNESAAVLAGVGIVESPGGSVAVAPPLPGVVKWVIDEEQFRGKVIKKDEVLLELDDREYRAKLVVYQAKLASAQADLKRTQELPREEDLVPLRAAVKEAQATVAESKRYEELYRRLLKEGTRTEEEYYQKYFAFKKAEAQLEVAEANLKREEAGAWEFEELVKEAAVKLAEAEVAQVENDLARLVVRCGSEATLLQVDVRNGEYVGSPPGETVIMLGSAKKHVRVYLDALDAPRFQSGASATARIPGDPSNRAIPLNYVAEEPLIVPKPIQTGEATERVDVRVLPVIYEFEREADQEKVYEQMKLDVYIDQS